MTAPSGPGGPVQVVVPGAGWVDVLSRAIVQVGFPVVVAGVLLWFLLTRFQGNMDMIATRMAATTANAEKLISATSTELQEVQKQTALLEQLVVEAQKLSETRIRELEEIKGIAGRMERARPSSEAPR